MSIPAQASDGGSCLAQLVVEGVVDAPVALAPPECLAETDMDCATAFVVCVTAIAVPTVSCGKVTLSIHHCSAVATGGAHGVSIWGFGGSVSWQSSYTGVAADAFAGTLQGACDWPATAPDPGTCDHKDQSPVYTKVCAICRASATVSVTTTAAATAIVAGVGLLSATSTASGSEHRSYEG